MKFLFTFFALLPLVTFSQEDCKELKFGWNKTKVCDLHGFKKLDPDSIAKAHLMISDKIYMATVPSDSMLKAHAFFYQFPQLGENTCVVSSSKQSKTKRMIGVVNPDYSTSMIMYKKGIRNGGAWEYAHPLMIKNSGKYKNGLQKGWWKYWDENGNLLEIKKFKNGVEIESFSGRKLKSLKIIRFGPKINYGIQTLDAIAFNDALLSMNPSSVTIPKVHLTANYGIECGNPSSLTLSLYQRINFSSGALQYQLGSISYGGKFYYTFLQTKKRNFRLGTGLERGEMNYNNTSDAINPANEFLIYPDIKYAKAVNADFSFQITNRKYIFRKKSNYDMGYNGIEIGYTLPVKNGVFKDINNNIIQFSQSPFSYSGFHISIFIFVTT